MPLPRPIGARRSLLASTHMGCASSKSVVADAPLQRGTTLSRCLTASEDDRLDLSEFSTLLLELQLGLTKSDAEKMFSHADKDGNGTLRVKELAHVVSAARDEAKSVPIRVIVPSTQKVDAEITPEAMQARVDLVLEFMSQLFGGATASAPQRGAYRADDGHMVYEQVRSVMSFCTPAQWKLNHESVRGHISGLCGQWGQECIALDFAGVLEYVYATEPSAEELWSSVVSRIRTRRSLGMLQAAPGRLAF